MTMNEKTLGSIIRLLRKNNGWTLRQMSKTVGISVSTLCKVEHDKLTLTYVKLQQVSSRLGMTLAGLLASAEIPAPTPVTMARRSLATTGGSVKIFTPGCDYECLCADLRTKRMTPFIARIRTRDASELGELRRHPGEELLFVLEGTVEVHLQFYSPVILAKGEWIYFDSAMEHTYVSNSGEHAVVLVVCSAAHPDLLCGAPTGLASSAFHVAALQGFSQQGISTL
jgi:transcriptional regulator with XRE-family HTH domain